MTKIHMKATVVYHYLADTDDYGDLPPSEMAALDAQSIRAGEISTWKIGTTGEVTVEPMEEVED